MHLRVGEKKEREGKKIMSWNNRSLIGSLGFSVFNLEGEIIFNLSDDDIFTILFSNNLFREKREKPFVISP